MSLYAFQLHAELESIISGKNSMKTDVGKPEEKTSDVDLTKETTPTGADEVKTEGENLQEDGELPKESEEFKTLKAELK